MSYQDIFFDRRRHVGCTDGNVVAVRIQIVQIAHERIVPVAAQEMDVCRQKQTRFSYLRDDVNECLAEVLSMPLGIDHFTVRCLHGSRFGTSHGCLKTFSFWITYQGDVVIRTI